MTRKKTFQILIFVSCIGILLFGLLVRPRLFVLPEKGNRPDYLFEGVHMLEFVAGVKTMEMSASSASLDRDEDLLNMQDLEAVFFLEGQEPVHLVSPDAGLHLTKGGISLYHPTINMILSDVPISVHSTHAVWQSRKGQLVATGNVRLSRSDLSISSETLNMDQLSGRVKFFGRAKAQWVF